MDIYEQMINYFIGLPCMDIWEEMRVLFRRRASKKPDHWLLPVKACEAVRGTPEQAIPAAVAFACSHISIILVDDMLDFDPRGEYQRIGAPVAANLSCAYQSAGLAAIAQCETEAGLKMAALQSLNQMILTIALGQFWDIQCPADEATYWHIVETKSSPFFGAALHIGALFGGASVETAGKLKQLGNLYGEMIQIHDDLNDTMAVPASPDWLQGRSPLPILFAKVVDHPERSRFLELCTQITDEGALLQAQDILVRCGAVSYCVDQLLRRYQSAREVLRTIELARPDSIESLLEESIAPVRRLFEAVGESPPAFSTFGGLGSAG